MRELEDGARIVFFSERKIYIFPEHGRGTVFHRWGARKGFYRDSWKIFRQRLLKKKHLDYRGCFEIAAQYEIPLFTVYKSFDEIIAKERRNNEK